MGWMPLILGYNHKNYTIPHILGKALLSEHYSCISKSFSKTSFVWIFSKVSSHKRILNPARMKIWDKMLFPQDWGGFLIGFYSYFANTVMKKFKFSVLMSADKAFTKVATQPLRSCCL